MIPNIIPTYLSKGANFSYEKVNPEIFGQMNLETDILTETLDYEGLEYQVLIFICQIISGSSSSRSLR